MENSEKATKAYFLDLAKKIQLFDKNITEVNDLTTVGLYNYEAKTYSDLISLLKEGRLDEATKKYCNKTKTFEDITVISFKDQLGISHIAVFYDSDNLWQDTEIKDLFEVRK